MKRIISAVILISLLLCGCVQASTPTDAVAAIDPRVRTYYEIFVASFYDSDGDGVGDLKGIEEKLDYLNDKNLNSNGSLHVTGLWLMPIMPSPTYHKYDVTDYYSVDEEYGSLADFESLCAACRERGVSVIIDLVLNHTSSEHEWFKSACSSIRAGECENDGDDCAFSTPCAKHNDYVGYYNFSNVNQGGYTAVSGTNGGWYYESRFWSGMPDLNLDNPSVRAEIEKIVEFWLEKGADGFRLDAVTSYYTGSNEGNTEFLAWLTDTAKGIKRDAYLVAETWTDSSTILSLYESGVDSCFNFPFSQNDGSIISAVNTQSGSALAKSIERWNAALSFENPDAIDAPFLTNHDNGRSAGALKRDLALEKQAAAVYLLMPGNPFIYYGEEIGMTGSGKDENKRASFTWSLSDDTGLTLSPKDADRVETVSAGVAEQLADKNSLLRFYIEVIRVRNSLPAVVFGEVAALDTDFDTVCAYTSSYGESTVAVVHNLGDEAVEIPSTFEGYSLYAGLSCGEGKPRLSKENLYLPPNSTAVLEKR